MGKTQNSMPNSYGNFSLPQWSQTDVVILCTGNQIFLGAGLCRMYNTENANYSKIGERLSIRHVHSGREHLSLSHGTHWFYHKLTCVTSANVTPKHITAYATSNAPLEGQGNGHGCVSYFYLIKCPKWKQDMHISHLPSIRLLQQMSQSLE